MGGANMVSALVLLKSMQPLDRDFVLIVDHASA